MASPVTVRFQVEGVQHVQNAFRSVEQCALAAEQAQSRASSSAAKQRVTAAQKEADERVKAHASAVEKISRKEETEADRMLRTVAGAEHAKIKAAEDWARARARIIENSARMAGRIAEQEANKEIAELKRVQAAREKFARAIGGRVTSTLGHDVNRVTQALTLGGGYALAEAVHDSLSTQKDATILANTAKTPESRSFTAKEIEDRAKALHIGQGVDKKEAIKGLQAYTDISGDLESGMKSAEFAAKVAKGQGADFSEVMKTLGTLKVENPHLDSKGLEDMLGAIVGGARIGAISSPEMAHQAGKIASTASLYTGDQGTQQRHLLGLAQLVRPVVGSAAESATVVTRLGSDLSSNREKIRNATHYDIKGSDGRLKDLSDVIPALMKATGGDTGALKKIGVNRESMHAFDALRGTYLDAGGGDAGAKAVAQQIKRFEDASVSREEIETNFAAVMATSSEKMDHALTMLRETLETRVTPIVERFAEKLSDPKVQEGLVSLANAIGKTAEWFAENPWKGLGAVVLGAVTKDLAAAAIGEGVKAILTRILGGGGGGIGGLGAMGALGPVGVAVAGATAAVAYGSPIVEEVSKGAFGGEDTARNLTAKLKAGTISVDQVQKIVADANKRLDGRTLAGNVGNLLWSPFSENDSRQVQQRKYDEALTGRGGLITPEFSEQLQRAIAEAVERGSERGTAKGAERGTRDGSRANAADPGNPGRHGPQGVPLSGGAR